MAEYAFGTSWEILSLLAAFLSVIVSIILLMVSRLFASPKLEQTAKAEIVFAASTVILVMFVITVIGIAEEASVEYVASLYGPEQWAKLQDYAKDLKGQPLASGWGGTTGFTVIDVNIAYLNNIAGCAVTFLNALYVLDIVVQAVLSIVMEVVMSELITGFFMNFFSERITNFTHILTFYLIIYYLTFHILMFLKHFGMFFFTFGVMLRAFPPTRGAGAFIMALCIGLYFIFPLAYILMGVTMLEAGGPIICDISDLPEVEGCYKHPDGTVECSAAGAFDIKKAVFGNSLNLKVHSNVMMEILQRISGFLNNFVMVMCFLPLLAFMITLSFVLSTSSFFGATIPEVGKGLVKLI